MARITVEDCLKNVDDRFILIHLAAKRVRQLRKGAEPLVVCRNKDIVTALREIATGKVKPIFPTSNASGQSALDSFNNDQLKDHIFDDSEESENVSLSEIEEVYISDSGDGEEFYEENDDSLHEISFAPEEDD